MDMIYYANQDFNPILEQAKHNPVFIHQHGKLSHVLVSYETYQKITSLPDNALMALTPPPEIAQAMDEIEFEIPERSSAKRPNIDLTLF